MTDAPTIGVVGSADVASALRSIGFQVITGEDFRSTATAISNRLNAGGDFPVVVADHSDSPALSPWTIKTSTQTHLVVLGATPGIRLMEGSDNRLELPATVNDLLTKLRYQSTLRPIGAHLIQSDGSVADPATLRAAAEPVPLPLPLPELDGELEVQIKLAQPVTEVTAAEVESPTPVAQAAPVPVAVPVTPSATQGFPEDLFLSDGSGTTPTQTAATPAVKHTPISELPQAPVLPPAPVRELAHFDIPSLDDVLDADPGRAAEPEVDPTPASLPEPARQVAEAIPAPAPAPAAAPIGWPADGAFPQPTAAPEPATVHVPTPAAPAPFDQASATVTSPVSAPAPATDPDVDDYFARRAATLRPRTEQSQEDPRPRGTRGKLIVSAAGKGGVGKSTTAVLLADKASEKGLKAIVVDANRGQADLRKYLRLGDAPLRSAYDAYATGNPEAALLSPTDYGHLRQAARLDVPDFGLVLGPPREYADPRYVTAATYGLIIDYALSVADVVIVDTQIIEAHHTDLWSELLVPALRTEAWLVAITDESSPGVSNLLERLGEMQQLGVTNARTLVLATKYDNFTQEDAQYFQNRFAAFGTLIGSTGVDMNFHDQMNLGRIISDSPAIEPAISAILARVTGRSDLFTTAPQQTEKRKGGLLGGLFGGRK